MHEKKVVNPTAIATGVIFVILGIGLPFMVPHGGGSYVLSFGVLCIVAGILEWIVPAWRTIAMVTGIFVAFHGGSQFTSDWHNLLQFAIANWLISAQVVGGLALFIVGAAVGWPRGFKD